MVPLWVEVYGSEFSGEIYFLAYRPKSSEIFFHGRQDLIRNFNI